LSRPRDRMSSERRRAMDGPSPRAVGQVGEPKEPDEVGRISGGGLSFGDFSLATQRKVTRPRPKGGRNPVEGRALVSHAAQPHQGASRRLRNPARVCCRGAGYVLRCNALRILHPTAVPLRGEATSPHQLRERPNTLRYSNLRFDNAGGLWAPSP